MGRTKPSSSWHGPRFIDRAARRANPRITTPMPVDKAILLLDLLEIGRRKYTPLRQTLLPENINFPSYSKVEDLRNELVSRNLVQLYPDPHEPIGVQSPCFSQVKKTLERIFTTLNPLNDEEFPLTFHIADGLDGSGCHTLYQ